jgi:hypothetical protein
MPSRNLDGPASMPRSVAYGQESSLAEYASVVKIFILIVKENLEK